MSSFRVGALVQVSAMSSFREGALVQFSVMSSFREGASVQVSAMSSFREGALGQFSAPKANVWQGNGRAIEMREFFCYERCSGSHSDMRPST
jgi:hypothetical protein